MVISPELLRSNLHLPSNVQILGARWNPYRRAVELLVDGMKVAQPEPGKDYPTIDAQVTMIPAIYNWKFREVPREGDD